MTELQGGCQCGRIRYSLAGSLPPAYACHCDECRKQSGSAFGMSMAVAWSRLSVKGQWQTVAGITFRGKPKLRCFCSNCGTRLWHRASEQSEWITLKVGSLDDASQISPRGHLWVSKKQPWIILDPALPAFATQPDDVQHWRGHLT